MARASFRPDGRTVWLFDLDNTLHDAGAWVFPALHRSMGEYTVQALAVEADEARRLNHLYWQRYGATLLGLMRHHGVQAAHFLHRTHELPGLEARLSAHRHDLAALAALPGRRVLLTNAPRAYAERVLGGLGIAALFDAVVAIDDMRVFGDLRPKPDARMLRVVARRLGVSPRRCVLVEDTLVHQKSARRLGMGTVWMQRFLRPGPAWAPGHRLASQKPPYVDRRVRRLRALLQGR